MAVEASQFADFRRGAVLMRTGSLFSCLLSEFVPSKVATACDRHHFISRIDCYQWPDDVIVTQWRRGASQTRTSFPCSRGNAATGSAVGQIHSYEEAKIAALAMPTTTDAEKASRTQAVADANAMLDAVANKPVTPEAIAQVDNILGIDSSL